MKKLPVPAYDDDQIITSLADNIKLRSSYPHLKETLPEVKAQYLSYVAAHGNAWNIRSMTISPELKAGLLSHYNNPPRELKFINFLRDTDDYICAMCGSKFPFTLDHIMPKDHYPEFAIFSNNLVPACQCNIKRGTALKGNPVTLERVLHPYFDDVFVERQLSCLIQSTDNFELITLDIIYLNQAHPQIDAIKFHVENIVKRAGLEKYLRRTKWTKLSELPSLAINNLFKKGNLTPQDVRNLIAKELEWHDESTGTPNNWDSIFLHGLLNSPDVVDWITQRHNQTL